MYSKIQNVNVENASKRVQKRVLHVWMRKSFFSNTLRARQYNNIRWYYLIPSGCATGAWKYERLIPLKMTTTGKKKTRGSCRYNRTTTVRVHDNGVTGRRPSTAERRVFPRGERRRPETIRDAPPPPPCSYTRALGQRAAYHTFLFGSFSYSLCVNGGLKRVECLSANVRTVKVLPVPQEFRFL